MDAGPEAMASADELNQVRRQGRNVRVKALALAAALTLLTLVVPAY